MVTYVLEASSVLRLLDKETGFERVAEVVEEHLDGSANAIISAVHWGEIFGRFFKRHGVNGAESAIAALESLQLVVIPANMQRAERSAAVRARLKIPFVDSFAVELASLPNTILITADYDFDPAKGEIRIEFLPTKPKA